MVTLQQLKTAFKAVLSSTDIKINNVKDYLTNKIEDIPQPSWVQNDTTANDYIKDRTHYIDESYRDSLAIFTSEELQKNVSFADGRYYLALPASTYQTNNYPNELYSYRVVFNGVNYFVKVDRKYGGRCMGNANIYDSNVPDTGEPFFILQGGYGGVYAYIRNDKPCTIQIYELANYEVSIKQLDEKFIPDTIARKSDIPDDTPTITVDDAMNADSENPVQNKIVKEYIDTKFADLDSVCDEVIALQNSYIQGVKVTQEGDTLIFENGGDVNA